MTSVGFKDPASVEAMIARQAVTLMTIDEWESTIAEAPLAERV